VNKYEYEHNYTYAPSVCPHSMDGDDLTFYLYLKPTFLVF